MEAETTNKTQALTDKELIKILLVEDDAVDRKLVERALAKNSKPVEFTLEFAESLSAAIEQLSNNKQYDIILLDLMLPDSHGVETVQRVREINPHIPIVVLTGLDDEQTALLAIENGATDHVIKSQSLDNILFGII